jgi:hypothetical protein
MTRREIGHRFVQVALIEKQMIRVLQCHICANLTQSFQSGSDMRLGLVLEKCFITGLAQGSGSVHDGFGERVERNAAIRSEIVSMARLPCARCLIWPDLQQDKIILAGKVPGHLRECFPIDSFVVDAQAAPCRFVLEDLVKETCDA